MTSSEIAMFGETPQNLIKLTAFLALLLTASCDRSSPGESSRAAESGQGVIHGRVIITGAVPLPKIIPGSPQATDESIVVGSNNGLKNVIVFLENAPKATFVQQTPAVLDQINCIYVPHVLAIQTGQILRLKSSDNVMHNIHLKCQVNDDANYGFAKPGTRDITLSSAEAPFPVKCDVHPWMSAWIGVFDHPWFAVTADDGTFTIDHVPPGDYTLAAWQEVLPQQEQQITVSFTGQTEADFTFQAP
jgi:hypothetical protein